MQFFAQRHESFSIHLQALMRGQRPMMGFRGMLREEVEELLVGFRKDIMNPSIHACFPV